LKPARRRALVGWIKERFHVSTSKACHLAQFSRTTFYRKTQAKDQSALRLRIREIAYARPRFGFQRIHVMLRRGGLAGEQEAGSSFVSAGTLAAQDAYPAS
jgi:hypothetical protein